MATRQVAPASPKGVRSKSDGRSKPAPKAKPEARPRAKPASNSIKASALNPIPARSTPSAPAAAAPSRVAKQKLVRDRFTLPQDDYAIIDVLKLRARQLLRPAKKSEILRAGVHALQAMSDQAFRAVLATVPNLKKDKAEKPAATAAAKPAKGDGLARKRA